MFFKLDLQSLFFRVLAFSLSLDVTQSVQACLHKTLQLVYLPKFLLDRDDVSAELVLVRFVQVFEELLHLVQDGGLHEVAHGFTAKRNVLGTE